MRLNRPIQNPYSYYGDKRVLRMKFVELIKSIYFAYQWRKQNKHNQTVPVNRFPKELVKVGRETYGKLYVQAFNEETRLRIGHYCSIGPDVSFILSAEHPLNYLSTFPFRVKLLGEKSEAISKGDIVIGDDVWIGYGATILSGVNIGTGAVIAACALVSDDVPPYAIVAGVPAKIVKYRFDFNTIQELSKMDFGNLERNMIKEKIDSVYKEITSPESAKKIVDCLMKKKLI